MKLIHDEEKDFYLSQAHLFLDELTDKDLYATDGDSCVRDYPSTESYYVTSGASKIAIIFRNKDWVIKIPYFGRVEDNSDCCRPSGEACPHTDESVVPCHECPHHKDDIDYTYYSGACHNTIEIEDEWNYCELESKLWIAAQEAGLEKLFLRTMKIGMHNGSPIYIQEKADIIGLSSTSPSPESKSRFTNSFADRHGFDDEFFGAFLLDYYGEIMLDKFFTFIEKYGICDFHRGNFGFQDNRPVFVDYSGFNS